MGEEGVSAQGLPPLDLLLAQAGFRSPVPKVPSIPRHFFGQPSPAIDPTNPMDQMQADPNTQGTQVDPRFLQALAAVAGQSAGLGDPSQPVNPSALPAYEPRVGVESANPHPTLTAIAYGIQNALASQPQARNGRQRGGDAFLGGLLSGASGTITKADQQRQAANTQNRTAAAQMNLMNAALSAKESKAPDNEPRMALSQDLITASGLPGYRDGQLVSMKEFNALIDEARRRHPASSQQAGVVDFDPRAVALGIKQGTLPPDPGGYSRGQWGVIAGHLQKLGVDVTKLTLNYRAIRQQVQTMNQGQSLQYRAAISKATPTLDYTEQLVRKLQAQVPSGQVKEFNRASLAAVVRGAFGPDAAATATQLVGQISGPLNGEMATVYSRGGVPTDEARRAVNRQLSADMGTGNMLAAISAMRRDLNFAQTAMDEVGAWSPWNPSEGGTVRPFDLGSRVVPGAGAPPQAAPATAPTKNPPPKPGGFWDTLIKGGR